MRCTCSPPHRSYSQFLEAVEEGLVAFRRLHGAFSILRNGGYEQTVRSLLLVPLQDHLDCLAFTEISAGTSEQRIDIVLVCRNCEKTWANVEIKHNFSAQVGPIKKRKGEAIKQLNDYKNMTSPSVSFCVQLVTHLTAPNSASPPANLRSFNKDAKNKYRNHVATYKRFLLPEDVKRAKGAGYYENKVAELLDRPPFTSHMITANSGGNRLEAAVWCWVWRLNKSGNLVSVP